uniref:Cytochrome p450 n=1 Tax=Croton stellatopilosus TaxID=431156 RepID=A0A3G2CK17_9ROSI|nr:cytochrome p450 [Croton stellatopilosus]
MANFQEYTILFLIWIATAITVRAVLKKFRTKRHLPPSPPSLPIVGHLHLLGPIPHQALYKLSTRYGPLIQLFLGSVPCVVASTPEMAKEFLKTHETSFLDRPKGSAVEYLSYGADFSFAPYGPYWKFMKKICMTELLGRRMLDQLLPIRREEIVQFLHFVQKKASVGEPVDVGQQLLRLTNNIISRMFLSERCANNEDESNQITKLVQEIAEISGSFNLSDHIWFLKNIDLQGFGKRVKKIRQTYDTMIERIIAEHEKERKIKQEKGEEGESIKNVLDILLDMYEDDKSEMKLTRDNIKSFVLDIFGGGTDTSAITIQWALAELITHPEIMKKAREEIDSVVGTSRLAEESDIPNLPYLQSIVKETLRIHPTGPLVVRESTEDCYVNGYEIPARTRLFVNVWAIGRDPNYWENPLEFCPERFFNAEAEGKSQLDVRGQFFHLLPFGSGKRGCPGASLALQVVHSTLAVMIQCFEWKVDGGNGTINMQEGPGITLPMVNPLICVPIIRLNPFPPFSST